MKTLIMVAFVALSFVAEAAEASPIDWSYEHKGGDIVWDLRANENFTDITLRIEGNLVDEVYTRDTWNAGQRWLIQVDAPEHSTIFTLRFDVATINGSWTATVQAPFSLREQKEVVDYQVLRWNLDGEKKHSAIIQANRSLEDIDLKVRTLDGERRRPQVTLDEKGRGRYKATWASGTEDVLKMSMTAYADNGSGREYHFVPWSLDGEVNHMNFAFNSAEIVRKDRKRLVREAERLQEAIEKVEPWVDAELYVAGYTDTVGEPRANQALSERRARAIAQLFANEGIDIPIRIQGFGESVLAVGTPDNTRESANRRAVFVLRVGSPPTDDRFPRDAWKVFQP